MTSEHNTEKQDLATTDSPITVNIFGADYAIRNGADPEYIRSVAAHVDHLMRELSERVAYASSTKLAVLAALQLTDQIFSEKKGKSCDHSELVEHTDQLLSRLDQTLLEVVE
jgi:cell division protein ZapA